LADLDEAELTPLKSIVVNDAVGLVELPQPVDNIQSDKTTPATIPIRYFISCPLFGAIGNSCYEFQNDYIPSHLIYQYHMRTASLCTFCLTRPTLLTRLLGLTRLHFHQGRRYL
jgi:hypothetical protein